MKLFAISDLHLPFGCDKPMTKFGEKWNNYTERIKTAWDSMVESGDLVLLAGDISWALKLDDAKRDLEWIMERPGIKVISKGNHCYWFKSISKLNALQLPNMYFVQANKINISGISISGTQLYDYDEIKWTYIPNQADDTEESEEESKKRMINVESKRTNELNRLNIALESLDVDAKYKILMLHHPPIGENAQPNFITEKIAPFKPHIVVYGHLHSLGDTLNRIGADCVIAGTRYVLTSADWLDCTPKYLATIE